MGLAIALPRLKGCRQNSSLVKSRTELDRKNIPYPYPELGVTIDNYPRVDGSTSTQPLQMILACQVFGLRSQWFHDERDDTRKLWPIHPLEYDNPGTSDADLFQRQILDEHVNKFVQYHGTTEAYFNLIGNRVDLIFAARLPSDDELNWPESSLGLDARPVALDAFVFLLNAKNPVTSLTIAQIRDIYSGQIANWRDVGGPEAFIRPYQRPRNSGSQELMQKLVMNGRAMIKSPDLLTGSLMSSTFLALDDDVHGIGYSVYYYQEFMSPRKDVKACAVDAILPTAESIRSRRYPFLAEVYVVVRRDLPPQHPACRLRDWLLEPTGQGAVEESGYVAVSEVPAPVPDGAESP